MGLLRRANSLMSRALPLKHVMSRLDAPVASITFDDFPRSAWTVGGPLLARYGARGTYYAAGGMLGRVEEGIDYYTEADLQAVQAAGHEIGAHSFTHEKAPETPTRRLLADTERNAAALEPMIGGRMTSYAYPYGEVSPRAKAAMGARFANARGIRKDINAGLVDLAMLNAIPLEHRRWVPKEIDAAVARAVDRTGWLILFTHDVDDAPTPFGCTPQMLEYALAAIAGAGIEMIPVRQAMARVVFGAA
jgi:peptidoglycan/xylan/chitin deacetylase (PgdA/CDA1 family)